jgi:two-component system NarL family sensor kinase
MLFRRALPRHLLLTAVAAVLAATLVTLGVWRYARTDAARQASGQASQIAAAVLKPGPIAPAVLLTDLRPFLSAGLVQRVKVFRVSGDEATIVASDESRVVGLRSTVDPARSALLSSGRVLVRAVPHNAAHQYELALPGSRMEVFVSFHDPSGNDMRLELYVPVNVAGTTGHVTEVLLPVVLLGLLVLATATVPLSAMMARRFADARAAEQYGLAAAELTRRDLARRLHDGVIPALAGSGLLLETGRPELVARAQSVIAGEVRSLRTLLTELVPEEPISAVALRRLVSEISMVAATAPPRVAISVDPVATAAAVPMNRIAGELLRNAFRHAGASAVTVRASGGRLVVSDDGCGFAPAAARSPGHVGLRLVEHAVRASGGRLTIDSSTAGTTVTVDL